MPLYRKKPVTVEARHFNFYMDCHAIAAWCGGRVPYDPAGPVTVEIPTLDEEGVVTANVGDYIVRGVQGEFYPCKPDIFHATYELVGEEGGAA